MDPVQKKKWVPLAKNLTIIGTYAQTELGHGKEFQFSASIVYCWVVV